LKLYRHEASRGLFAIAKLLINEEMVGGRETATTDEDWVQRGAEQRSVLPREQQHSYLLT